jgi:hypothetical protein
MRQIHSVKRNPAGALLGEKCPLYPSDVAHLNTIPSQHQGQFLGLGGFPALAMPLLAEVAGRRLTRFPCFARKQFGFL